MGLHHIYICIYIYIYTLEYAIRRVQVNRGDLKLVHINCWLMPTMLIYWQEAYIL